ncbi:MAG: hypothetical protein KZQ82_16525 [Candidatus Thiodiazotropha sp. (ex Lucinoma annulata)]|nr:hypothetical protein [Candidatus Thiodiazotropha sp. (ex Lucinoma borealis)]MCU7841379.1 hypothetical protein [Candidatus Thiodiazotropha sp. (ex Troendleina suluensis)]MCU7866191.1 hypothetical protein [Candidatus Thiodiazotropha sp. (ex Lucinoma borealis)]MCU7885798.1 hypothetical protein [Candidatus Thiodiazotropha sp. (ex Lucinoma annulata)]
MFSFFERNVEKRILSDHLQEFGLGLADLSPAVLKRILDVLHRQVCAVARKYNEPVYHVSENIVSSATWGLVYCLLGPTKLLQIHPGFKDMAEEIEMELLISERGYASENNIYKQVFTILLDTAHCHPEVSDLLNRVRLTAANLDQQAGDRHYASMH